MRYGQGTKRPYVYLVVLGLLFVAMAIATSIVPKRAAFAGAGDVLTFLQNNARTNYNSAETAINAGNVSTLEREWIYPTGGNINTQPIVINNHIYWGSWDGNEYATDLKGDLLWSSPIGAQVPDCTPPRVFGIGSTATVATVAINGTPTQVVFVGANDPKFPVATFYALDAGTGAILWKKHLNTSTRSFFWSSPAIYNGSIYVGLSSVNDCPLIQPALLRLNASTGAIQNLFVTVPNACAGGSIWSSPAIDESTGIVYITTGNGVACSKAEPYAQAIIALKASNLAYIDSWQVPASQQITDSDFGATPTLFTASIGGKTRNMIGAVNKNGTYYALDRTNLAAGPLWSAPISTSTVNISSSAWDGTSLYVAGQKTVIGGTNCLASVRALDPATGSFIWQTCFTDGTLFAPVTAIPGVVFAEEGSHLVALASASGQVLFNSQLDGTLQGAATISNGVVYVGSGSGFLYTFGLPGTVRYPAGTIIAADTFQRPDQTYWGLAADGQPWADGPNSYKTFTITNNTGQLVPLTTRSYNALLGPGISDADVLLQGTFSSSTSFSMGAILRWVDRADYYKAAVNGSELILSKVVQGKSTVLAHVLFPATAGVVYAIRFDITGATLMAKAWPTLQPEPQNWMVSASDSSFTSGYCGIYLFLQKGVSANMGLFQATAL